jgi:hypothetical protein
MNYDDAVCGEPSPTLPGDPFVGRAERPLRHHPAIEWGIDVGVGMILGAALFGLAIALSEMIA